MGLGWKRAFCTTILRDEEEEDLNNPISSPTPNPKFILFSSSSNPSTPRLQPQQLVSNPNSLVPSSNAPPHILAGSPKLQCKTTKNRTSFSNLSEPSSPRSPSTISFLKSKELNSKSRCSICLQKMKPGQGTAIFTAECSHSFHFPCIAAHVHKNTCPACSSSWKEMPLLSFHNDNVNNNKHSETKSSESPRTIRIDTNTKIKPDPTVKVYGDDEPLNSPQSGFRFSPIPESDEENDNVESGESFNNSTNLNKTIEVNLSPEVAVISAGRTSETYAMVMKVKAPATMGKTARAPIDLVAVLDVSGKMSDEKLLMMKKAMRIIFSSLSGDDRLSIVAFSKTSKRLFPLRRMTSAGKRSARRIVESVVAFGGIRSNSMDALKKAVKVLEDRRARNPATSIILLSDGQVDLDRSSSFNHPVHAVALGHTESEELLAKAIGNVLSVVVQDLSVQLGFVSGSAPAKIAAVYGSVNKGQAFGSGSIRLGELYAEEERELLVELKVPSAGLVTRAHRVLSARCSYKDLSTQEVIDCKEQAWLVPRPDAIRSNLPSIQRMRSRFITIRALAEAQRLIERNEFCGAHHMLASGRALLLQSRPGSVSNDEFICELEAELSELSRKKLSQQRDVLRGGLNVERDISTGLVYLDEKAESLTPTSAWRAAEKLARLAVMRKSMNRVSDLHGFENAGF